MKPFITGLLAILLCMCMGQGCPSSIFDSIGGDTGGDTGGDGTDTTAKGIPDGVYSGQETVVQSLDNVADAYPADSHTSTAQSSYTFGKKGHLLLTDGTSLEVGDVQYVSTQFGTVAEQITAVVTNTKVTQYQTQAQMVMDGGSGLSWTFTGTGLHTFQQTAGKVAYTGQLDMTSDQVGGVAYHAVIDYSATLEE